LEPSLRSKNSAYAASKTISSQRVTVEASRNSIMKPRTENGPSEYMEQLAEQTKRTIL